MHRMNSHGSYQTQVKRKKVKHDSMYKVKRVFEILQLAALAGVADLYAEQSDIVVTFSVYPLPTNSVDALKKDFACCHIPRRAERSITSFAEIRAFLSC